MALPKLPSLFKTPRHKQFDFKTRYYNAEKEELDQRIANLKKEIAAEGKSEDPDREARLREAFSKKRGNLRTGNYKGVNVRFLIILFALLALSYLILR